MDNGQYKLSIFASIFTLVQALLWSAISIYSIAAYTCLVEFPGAETKNESISTLFFTAYYLGPCQNSTLYLGSEHEVESAYRTYLWMLAYSIVSAVWIPTCALMSVIPISQGRCKSKSCYFPWILISISLLIMDLAAATQYVMDIQKTMTIEDFSYFLGLQGKSSLLAQDQGYTFVPAVIMALFFSRAVILWIVNLVLVMRIMKIVCIANRETQQSNVEGEETVIYERNHQEEGGRDNADWVNMFQTNGQLINDNKLEVYSLHDIPQEKSYPKNKLELIETINKNVNRLSPLGSKDGPRNNPRKRSNWKVDEFGIPIEEILPEMEDTNERQLRETVFDYKGQPASASMREALHPTSSLKRSTSKSNEQAPSAELNGTRPWTYLKPLSMPRRDGVKLSQEPMPQLPTPDYILRTKPGTMPELVNGYPFVLSRPSYRRPTHTHDLSWKPSKIY